MRKLAITGMATFALLAGACTSNTPQQTTPKDTAPADVQACHAFGNLIIQSGGGSISEQAFLNVITQVENASNADLRAKGSKLRSVVNGDPATRLKYEQQIDHTCYKLHLLNGSGAPI
jgi:hypothetical protein